MKKFLVLTLLVALMAPNSHSILYGQNASGTEKAPQTPLATRDTSSPALNSATTTHLDTKTGDSSAISCSIDSATTDSAKTSPTDQKTTDHQAPDLTTETPEPQIPFSYEGAEKVTINGIDYWQKTVFVPYLDLATSGEYKTIIYTLEGQEVGYIEYNIYREKSRKIGKKKKYGHIGYLLVHEPFRKKLGIGKYLFKQAIYFFHKSNLLAIKWLARPHHLSPADQKLSSEDRLYRLIAFYESLGAKIDGEKTDHSAYMTLPICKKSSERCRYPLFF